MSTADSTCMYVEVYYSVTTLRQPQIA